MGRELARLGRMGMVRGGSEGEVDGEGEKGYDVEVLLGKFGENLVHLTTPVFKIQAEALRTAPYMNRE